MKSKLFYAQLFDALLLFLLMLIVVPIYAQRIPEALVKRVDERLSHHGIHWVEVRAKGRDITLSGVAPTIESHQKAIEVAQNVGGVRRVQDKISPMMIAPYRMNIEYDGNILRLQGYLPSKQSKAALLQTLTTVYGDRIIDQIDIGTGEPEQWTALIEAIAVQTKNLELASVNIVDQEFHISGKITTLEQKKRVEQNLLGFTKLGYTLHNRIVALDEPAQVCQEKFNTLLGKEKIEFESGKSILKAKNRQLLQALSDIALLCPGSKIEVIGHTDNQGNHQKNLELSLERAKVVVAKLFGLGVGLERLEAKGAGENHPLATNKTPEGRAKNRRIEFKVMEE